MLYIEGLRVWLQLCVQLIESAEYHKVRKAGIDCLEDQKRIDTNDIKINKVKNVETNKVNIRHNFILVPA